MKKKITKSKISKPHRYKIRLKKHSAAKRSRAGVSKKPGELVTAKKEEISLHNLKPAVGSYTPKRILGRGPSSGHGKTSSRGSKGQTSRSGKSRYLGFEGGQAPLIRRVPKRGFSSWPRCEYQIVNLEVLSKIKEKIINPQVLEDNGLVKNKNKPVKILGDGEIKESITISAHAFSKKAEEKITSAGGKVEVLHA